MLKMLISFIAGTLLGALGQKIAGVSGMVVGSLVGMIVGWWGARRLMPR